MSVAGGGTRKYSLGRLSLQHGKRESIMESGVCSNGSRGRDPSQGCFLPLNLKAMSKRLMLLHTASRVFRQKRSGGHTAGCACDD